MQILYEGQGLKPCKRPPLVASLRRCNAFLSWIIKWSKVRCKYCQIYSSIHGMPQHSIWSQDGRATHGEVGSWRDGVLWVAILRLVLIAAAHACGFSCAHHHEFLCLPEPLNLCLLLSGL